MDAQSHGANGVRFRDQRQAATIESLQCHTEGEPKQKRQQTEDACLDRASQYLDLRILPILDEPTDTETDLIDHHDRNEQGEGDQKAIMTVQQLAFVHGHIPSKVSSLSSIHLFLLNSDGLDP